MSDLYTNRLRHLFAKNQTDFKQLHENHSTATLKATVGTEVVNKHDRCKARAKDSEIVIQLSTRNLTMYLLSITCIDDIVKEWQSKTLPFLNGLVDIQVESSQISTREKR